MNIKSGVFFLAVLFFIGCPAFVLLADSYFDQAKIQYLKGDLNEAKKNLEKSIDLNPQNRGARKLLDTILYERKKYFPQSDEMDKKRMETRFYALGKKAFQEKNFSVAIEYFARVVSIDPKNSKAAAYLEESKNKEAEFRAALVRAKRARAAGLFFEFVVMGILLSYLAVLLERYLFLRLEERRKNIGICFSCKAPLAPNIDLCPSCGAWIGTKLRASVSKEQADWFAKWRWKKNPFTLDIHPELFTGYREEVKSIVEKINSRSGHILITGPLGAGKTTLLRWLDNYLINDFCAVYAPRPPQEFNQLIKLIMEKMGVSRWKKKDFDIYHLNQLQKELGKNLIILLDEAHEFTLEVEKPLRTLGDLDKIKLVMAGLPETKEKFKTEIRPLYERLVLRVELSPLEKEEIKNLLKNRIESAGGMGFHPFTEDALDKIYELSAGLPRAAVKLCDAAVTRAINCGEDKITPKLIGSL